MENPSHRKVSRQEVEAGKTPRGAWTKKQLAEWGVPWPPPKGWREALERGHPIPEHRFKTTFYFLDYASPVESQTIAVEAMTEQDALLLLAKRHFRAVGEDGMCGDIVHISETKDYVAEAEAERLRIEAHFANGAD